MSENQNGVWQYKSLQEIAQVVSGGTPSRHVPEFWKDGTIPWVTPTDLTTTSGRFLLSTREKITHQGLASCSATLLPSGTLLMTSRATLGEIRISESEACTNQGFKSLVPLSNIHGLFLYYQMLLNKERYCALGIGSTFLEVNKRDTEKFAVFVPLDWDLQKRIAEILSTVDDAIEQTQALIDKTQQIKSGLMHDLFTRGITADGQLRPLREDAPELYRESELGWIPKEWRIASFEELISTGLLTDIQDGNHGELHPKREDFIPEGIPFLMARDIAGGNIDLNQCYRISREQFQSLRIGFALPGDVLLSHKGTIGETAIIPVELPEAMLSPQVTYYRAKSKGALNRQFLLSWMRSSLFKNRIMSLASQSTRDYVGITAQKKLLNIVIPNEAEQERITNAISAIDLRIETELDTKQELNHLKTGLMQDLLTGEVQVQIQEDPLKAKAKTTNV